MYERTFSRILVLVNLSNELFEIFKTDDFFHSTSFLRVFIENKVFFKINLIESNFFIRISIYNYKNPF